MTPGSERLVALGGIGGDAHSVGLVILRRFLLRAGYQVRYLATQNSVVTLCEEARGCDAVLVSNMDGHAGYYLRDLPAVRHERGSPGQIWYIGGNPTLTGGEAEMAALRDLGFDRVFPGYTEPREVVALLDRDIGVDRLACAGAQHSEANHGDANHGDANHGDANHGDAKPEHANDAAGLAAVVEPARPLAQERSDVLGQWSTGAAVGAIAANAAVLTTRRTLSSAQARARAQGRILIQPRTGVPTVAGQRELFRVLRTAGADVLSFQVDSLTRNNAYGEVGRVLKERAGCLRSVLGLNGFPMVNLGVEPLRAITREFSDVPMQVRHSTRDPRLLAEIALAGGVSAIEGGALSYNLPYYRDYPPTLSVQRWRYVDALAGAYDREGSVVVDREFFGVLTASLVPPCVAVAVNVLEALLAAEQGVRSVSLGYAEQGYRPQDIAAVRVLGQLGRRYLDAHGFPDVDVHTVFHQYMGAFPADPDKARELLRGSAVTAALSGATRLMLKTYVEAVRIPTAQENGSSLRLVREAVAGAECVAADDAAVTAEYELLAAEASAILDACLQAGDGDIGRSVVNAVELGYLDVPFAPSVWNAGLVLPVRDGDGAVRLADPGRLPLPASVARTHADLVGRRMRGSGMSVEEAVEHDVLMIARGDFTRWPLG